MALLQKAIRAHAKGEIDLAKKLYQKCLSARIDDPILYQNYGALLKQGNDLENSERVLNLGNKKYPHRVSILVNRANLYIKANKLSFALNDLLHSLRLIQNNLDKKGDSESVDVWLKTIRLARELGLEEWSIELCRTALSWHPEESQIRIETLITLQNIFSKKENNQDVLSELRSKQLGIELEKAPVEIKLEALLTQLSLNILNTDNESLEKIYYEVREAAKMLNKNKPEDNKQFIQNYHISCWNLGCLLVKNQNFELGWSLYDHGLQTPAAGQQKWQRSMQKDFSHRTISLWRGESLKGKHLLVIEEQAIGDVMMFLTLIPRLMNETKKISLMLGERLQTLYKRSFKTYIESGKIEILSLNKNIDGGTDQFDFQIPLGSICQYRFKHPSKYCNQNPVIIPNISESEKIRESYLEKQPNAKKIIGISWSGGGRKDRVNIKSVKSKTFVEYLSKVKDVIFVSLQYGNVTPVLERWEKQGFKVINDSSVDSLKNMDRWISQVNACDAILSVANTTIHGSGGLGKPTLCLLSQKSDWRWLSTTEVERSYWYGSVGIARQDINENWDKAMKEAVDWINRGCIPYDGPQWV